MGGSYKAPDLAAANREAVMASIETFPLQRQIEAASRIGGVVTVPIYKDGKETGQFKDIDFSKTSDVAQTKAIGQALADLVPIQAQRQLEASQQYGTQFAEQRRAELQALDPERYGTAAKDGKPGETGLYAQFLKDIGSRPISEETTAAPSYERVGMPGGPQDTGEAARIRSNLERQISAGLAQAGTLDPAMIRGAEQAARARGTSTGNLLGNLSAFRESRAVNEAISNADVQRRQQAIGLLQSGQTSSDVANRQSQEAFQNILAATGQRNTAMQQSFAGQMASQQQRQGSQQQNIANIQSALGLQPIVSQAAQLSGLHRLQPRSCIKECSRQDQVSLCKLDPTLLFRTLKINFKRLKPILHCPFSKGLRAALAILVKDSVDSLEDLNLWQTIPDQTTSLFQEEKRLLQLLLLFLRSRCLHLKSISLRWKICSLL